MDEFGLMVGRYPATVKSYDPSRRTCRIEIAGLTDGCDTLPEAEIEYPIGDKSRSGQNTTELEILPDDTVWIAFIGGDPRYPIITGYRNPQSGNSADWRRYHHANMELLADALMKFIAGGDVLVQSDTKITLKAPKVLIDSPDTELTGNALVQKALAFKGGMTGSGGDGGMTVSIDGDAIIGGKSYLKHKHNETQSVTSAPI